MGADRFGLFDDRDFDVPALLLGELFQVDGAGEIGRSRAHEENVEFKLFALHGVGSYPFSFFTASVTAGRI